MVGRESTSEGVGEDGHCSVSSFLEEAEGENAGSGLLLGCAPAWEERRGGGAGLDMA